MAEPIDELYFDWLYTNILRTPGRTPTTSYQSLMYALHRFEFRWLVSGDDNRAADGVALRYDFLDEYGIDPDDVDPGWFDLECSVFEMLFAFSKRCAFNTSLDYKEWFWIFLDNLNLSEISDGSYREQKHYIYPTLETFVGRGYDRHCRGGLFPVLQTRRDQRKVELWYQFNEYLVENAIP